MSKLGKFLSNAWGQQHAVERANPSANVADINRVYEMHEPYTLGVYYDEKLQRRDRKSIYTAYKIMMQDPTIAAALNLLVTAALGGHESRGEVVFVNPSDRVKGEGKRATRLRKLIEAEAPYLQSLINPMVFAFARNAIAYGDSYARVYPVEKIGISHILCNELVDTPNIQAFERAGKTVGFHVLEISDFEIRKITKLTRNQMIRMKMQRTTPVPVFKIENVMHQQLLQDNNMQNIPIIPSPPGGSLLQAVEAPYKAWVTGFAALNSQQIADSVNIQFATIDVSGMPEANQKKVKQGLQKSITELQTRVRSALEGGDEVFMTNWMFMPTWSEKQILNPLGDLTQRSTPLSMELVMTHLKRGVGALGLDLSLLGWMEMISGGLGDGAAFHTSAQVMQNAILIRQALSEALTDLIIMHFAYKTGEVFNRQDLPFAIEYYSDISAAATEANNNKLNRGNLTAMTVSALMQLKELGLDEKDNEYMLTSMLGMDNEPAQRIAKSLVRAKKEADKQEGGGFDPGDDNDPKDDDNQDDE